MKFIFNKNRPFILWILLSIMTNLTIACIFSYLMKINLNNSTFFIISGDAHEYIGYAESLQKYNTYSYEGNSYGRMPLYPIIIYFFRLIIPDNWAFTCIVLLQIILNGIASYYLAKISYMLFKSQAIKWISFILYQFCFVLKAYDLSILTESFSFSFLIFSIFNLFLFKIEGNNKNAFWSGFFITLAIFLRPYFILYLIMMLGYIIFNERKVFSKSYVYFTGAFVFLLGLWSIRNYCISSKVIFFQQNVYSGLSGNNSAYLYVWNYIKNTGEDVIWWEPNTLGSWLYPEKTNITPVNYNIPSHLFSSSVNKEDILFAKKLYYNFYIETNKTKKDSLERLVISEFDKLDSIYKKENYIQYHIYSRLRLIKNTLIKNGPVLPLKSYPSILDYNLELFIKIFSILTYYLTISLGITGIIFLIINYKTINIDILLLISLPLIVFIFLNQILRYTEFRLYSSVFIFLILFQSFTLFTLFKYFKKAWFKH